MLSDFHTHTLASDGALLPIELIRRYDELGFEYLAITDHVSHGSLERVIDEVRQDCRSARRHMDIIPLVGVELTHVPPDEIGSLADQAKQLGAEIVVVHGETVVEPVVPGTNMAAVTSKSVDILAHPGIITAEEARIAAENGVFLELSGRKGHSLSNGHVAKLGSSAGARMLVNSDAHGPGDLFYEGFPSIIAAAAGLTDDEAATVIDANPKILIDGLA